MPQRWNDLSREEDTIAVSAERKLDQTRSLARYQRGALLFTSVVAILAGAAIYLVALPPELRMSLPYAVLFAALGILQLVSVAVLLAVPTRRHALYAVTTCLAVITFWGLVRLGGLLPAPDPWPPVNSVIGFTDDICAGLQAVAVLMLVAIAVRPPSAPRSLGRRILRGLAAIPLLVLVLIGAGVGIAGASDGFASAGFPAGTVAPRNLPAGTKSTVEYCRPAGVPLAMDVYTPLAATRSGRGSPVALYVHGGGLVLGDRKLHGLGANLASHEGVLFTPLQQQLNARGFVVASIDYRLSTGTPWPAQIEDTKCAVRFLRAHAVDLGIDPTQIGAWGGSGGGQLVSLLGTAGPDAGFDHGQYSEQSSSVQAVVDMFGPVDLNDFSDASPFARTIVWIGLGSSAEVRRSASPITYVEPGAPPFLILQGTDDPMILPRQSEQLAHQLQFGGASTTFIEVSGTGHSMNTPGQRPSPAQLTQTVVEFFLHTL